MPYAAPASQSSKRVGMIGAPGPTCAEIAAALEPVGADDRQRDAMPYAGLLRRRDQVARPRLEEVQYRLVLERGRIRHVDDNIGACKRRLQALPGHGVDAPARRRLQHLMAARPEQRGQFRADQARTADDNDLHFLAPLSRKPRHPRAASPGRTARAVVTRPTVNSGLICTTYTGGPHARTSANG